MKGWGNKVNFVNTVFWEEYCEGRSMAVISNILRYLFLGGTHEDSI